jgi:uncharacterized repeat protein (TIGR01451 family)
LACMLTRDRVVALLAVAALVVVSLTVAGPVGSAMADPTVCPQGDGWTPHLTPVDLGYVGEVNEVVYTAEEGKAILAACVKSGAQAPITFSPPGALVGDYFDPPRSSVTLTSPQAISHLAILLTDAPPPPPQTAELTLAKAAEPGTYGAVGDVVVYSYRLTNTGTATLTGPFTVTDDSVTVTCPDTPVSLAPGESVTCTATHTITQADLDAGAITNIAVGHGFFDDDPVDSNPDTATVVAVWLPALALAKTGPTSVSTVGPITYLFTATNTGNVTLTDVVVADPLAGLAPLVCVPAQPATLPPGGVMSCTAVYTVTQADLDAGSIPNAATATGTDPDDHLVSATDDHVVVLPAAPGLRVDKTVTSVTHHDVGGVVTYRFVVTNTGTVTLTDLVLVDDKLGPIPLPATTLPPGGSLTATATHTITAADVAAGEVRNVALVTARTPQGEVVQAQDTALVRLPRDELEILPLIPIGQPPAPAAVTPIRPTSPAVPPVATTAQLAQTGPGALGQLAAGVLTIMLGVLVLYGTRHRPPRTWRIG